MPTRRMIHPEIWQSESIGRLTIRQRLVFIGMFSNADDQGRLRASAPVIRSMILPFDDVTIADVEIDIQAIEREKCIILYYANDSRFAQIVNWWRYQSPQWAYPSNIPAPDGIQDRLRYWRGKQIVKENWQHGEIDHSKELDKELELELEIPRSLPSELGRKTGKGQGKKPPKDGAEKTPRPRDLLFDAIAQVTCTDPATAGASIAKVESVLKKASPPYTPEEVLAFGEQWPAWKDKPPSLWQVKEQIGIVRQNGNARSNKGEPSSPMLRAIARSEGKLT